MSTPYPIQKVQDWITQQWVIWFGRRIDPKKEDWLIGPFGSLTGIGENFIYELAKQENLKVVRAISSAGILRGINILGFKNEEITELSEKVIQFYEKTSDYELHLQTKWNILFKPFGFLLRWLFSSRLNQLNVPLTKNESESKVTNEIIHLKNQVTNDVVYTIWYRTIESTGRVVYSGIYTTCNLPDQTICVKAIFPLPNGNATVIMKPIIENQGLKLNSDGAKFGQTGFYFLLKDSKGEKWSKYVKSFKDYLQVEENGDSIKATQVLTLWNIKVLEFNYQINQL